MSATEVGIDQLAAEFVRATPQRRITILKGLNSESNKQALVQKVEELRRQAAAQK